MYSLYYKIGHPPSEKGDFHPRVIEVADESTRTGS